MISNSWENTANKIEVHPQRCLRRRLNRYSCTLCIDNCPSQALSLWEGFIHLDHFQCTDCGRCVAVCPGETFVSNRSDIYSDIKNKKTRTLFISCYLQQHGTHNEVVVPCLGILSPEVILYLTGSAYTTVSLNTRSCDTCINRSVKDAMLKSMNLLVADFSGYLNTEIHISDEQTQNSKITSRARRSFLRTMGSGVAEFVSTYLSRKSNHEKVSHHVEKRLPAKLSLLHTSPLFRDSAISPLLRPQMSLTAACTFCPQCTGMCPTGALKRIRTNGEKKISFSPFLCSECGLCEAFCKKEAITISKVLKKYI